MIDPVIEFIGIAFAPVAVLAAGSFLGGLIVLLLAGSIVRALARRQEQ